MRKWILFLVIIGLVYVVSKASQKGENRSSFRQRFSETVSILVWVLIIAYVLSFLYWLYSQIVG
jgi:hypothetical protein